RGAAGAPTLPAVPPHLLFLFARRAEGLAMGYEGVRRPVPPPAGSVSLVPAGSPAWVWASGRREQLFLFLEPGLGARVAAEAFDLDPARLTVPPLDGLDLPQFRVPILAGGAELTARPRAPPAPAA